MLFRQLFDPESSTYTYLLAGRAGGNAVIIDPVREQHARDLALIRRWGVRLRWVLETHVHADHVTGAAALRDATGAQTAWGERAEVRCADRLLEDDAEVAFGDERLRVIATPGHTAGCVSFLWRDRLFTGDALLIGGCGRTDFQQGDPHALYRSVTGRLFALPDETLVYPAHAYDGRRVSCIGEERQINPRFAGCDEAGFVALMEGLELDPPRRIDEAVPANSACGAQRPRAG